MKNNDTCKMKMYVVGLIKNGKIFSYKIGKSQNVRERLKKYKNKTFLFSKPSMRWFEADISAELAEKIEDAVKKYFRFREYKNDVGATEVFKVETRRDLIAAIEVCILYPSKIDEVVWLAAHGLTYVKTLPLISLRQKEFCKVFDYYGWKDYFGVLPCALVDLQKHRLDYARKMGAYIQVLLAQDYMIVDVTCNFYSKDATSDEVSKMYFAYDERDRPLVFAHCDLMEAYEEADDFRKDEDTDLRTVTFREKFDKKGKCSDIWILNESGRSVQGEFAEEFKNAWRTFDFLKAASDD